MILCSLYSHLHAVISTQESQARPSHDFKRLSPHRPRQRGRGRQLAPRGLLHPQTFSASPSALIFPMPKANAQDLDETKAQSGPSRAVPPPSPLRSAPLRRPVPCPSPARPPLAPAVTALGARPPLLSQPSGAGAAARGCALAPPRPWRPRASRGRCCQSRFGGAAGAAAAPGPVPARCGRGARPAAAPPSLPAGPFDPLRLLLCPFFPPRRAPRPLRRSRGQSQRALPMQGAARGAAPRGDAAAAGSKLPAGLGRVRLGLGRWGVVGSFLPLPAPSRSSRSRPSPMAASARGRRR